MNKIKNKPTRLNIFSNENHMNQTSDFIQLLKRDLDNFSFERIFETLLNATNLKFLCDNKFFINDLDFTEGFSGRNSKE